ncbi:MAG TPA: hypothetical protein PLP66_09905 [Phycisphaerae bacterium]|nr:hypothetical protein [Phycisphaerae bacterium]
MSTSQLNDLLGQLEAALLDKDANLQSVMLRTEAFLQFAESASEHARREWHHPVLTRLLSDELLAAPLARLPKELREVLADIAAFIDDPVELASHFSSTPGQLLERLRRIKTEGV